MYSSRPRLPTVLAAALLATGTAHAAAGIEVNQLGFLPAAQKLAVVPASANGRFVSWNRGRARSAAAPDSPRRPSRSPSPAGRSPSWPPCR